MKEYAQISVYGVPAGLIWDVPPRHTGQHVEVAYGRPAQASAPADDGAAYKRVTDRSDGSVTYYRLASQGESRRCSRCTRLLNRENACADICELCRLIREEAGR